MRIASIDLGTNTFRLLIGDFIDGELRTLKLDRVVTRLGQGLTSNTNIIVQDALDRALEALGVFRKAMDTYGVTKYRVIGTNAFRKAQNSEHLVDLIRRETGLEVEVISGEQEAQLMASGVLYSLGITEGDCLIVDIGGGSTEVVLVREGVITHTSSISLGVVDLADRFPEDPRDIDRTETLLRDYVHKHISDVIYTAPYYRAQGYRLVATAGTPTTLAAIKLKMAEYDPESVNGQVLTKQFMVDIQNCIKSIPKANRSDITGLERGREDLMIPGIIILLTLLEQADKDEIIVSDGGLLEGIAVSLSLDNGD